MTATYDPIATTTLGSNATTITFSSIPATFTDLRIVLVGREIGPGGGDKFLRFNNNSSGVYSATALLGNGSSASSSRYTPGAVSGYFYLNYWGGFFDTQPQMITVDVNSYSSSTITKTALITMTQDINSSGRVERQVGLFNSTSPIDTITFGNISANGYAAGTTVTLYGIKAE